MICFRLPEKWILWDGNMPLLFYFATKEAYQILVSQAANKNSVLKLQTFSETPLKDSIT